MSVLQLAVLSVTSSEPPTTHRKRKPGINSRAVCLSDLETLQESNEGRSRKGEGSEETRT